MLLFALFVVIKISLVFVINLKSGINCYHNYFYATHSHNYTLFTEEQLIAVCLDFFIAGAHTTSTTLGFAFLNMIVHQDVQERVYQEIKEVLGDRKHPATSDRSKYVYSFLNR